MNLKIVRKCLAEGVSNPTLADIEHFHWIEDRTDFPGMYTREELYKYIHGGGDAFILDPTDPLQRQQIPLKPAKTKDGKKYIHTVVNGQETDYLLNLPDCE